MTEAQIKHMVNRFLGWKLPADFSPDAGISFKADYNKNTPHPAKHEPTGTNLFDASQATLMVRHMVEGIAALEASQPMLSGGDGMVMDFVFGKGEVVVTPGKRYGKPAVFIRSALQPGEVGASADRENMPLDKMVAGEIALTFPTEEHAKAVENSLIPAPASNGEAKGVSQMYTALKELTDACFEEFMGDVITEQDGDDEAVGGGLEGDMGITFGMIRRARAALSSINEKAGE